MGKRGNGKVKAVFLDRDGVICHRHGARSEERNHTVAIAMGRPEVRITAEDEIRVFFKALSDPTSAEIVNQEQEDAFWWRWGEMLMAEHGWEGEAAAKASREICAQFAYPTMLQAYHDASDAVLALRRCGCRLAVISNTFPSLEASIRSMGLAHHFEAFIASSLAGCSKPDPAIYRIALDSLGVQPGESVFVDDLIENADAAREMGFTAFHLDRSRKSPDWDNWTLSSLSGLVTYVRQQNE